MVRGVVVDGEVLRELVIDALQEGGLRPEDDVGAHLGGAGGQGDGGLLRDAHVQVVRAELAALVGAEAQGPGHAGCKHEEVAVRLGALEQVARRYGAIALPRPLVQGTARGKVEGCVVVPGLGVALCGSVALALQGVDVDHDGMVNVADLLEGGDEGRAVVAVRHVAVVEAHGPEEVVLRLAPRLAQTGEARVHAAVVLGDGHLVVVEDDDEVAAQLAGDVQALEGLSPAEGPVAYDRDDVLVPPGEVAGLGQAQCQADGGRGVADLEEVVVRLGGVAVAADLVVARGVEVGVDAPCEHLVRVGLVRDVEDEVVARRVEHVVQGDRRLDEAEVGTEVPTVRRGAPQ